MRDLKYDFEMRDFTCGNGYQIKWIFPENVHVNKDSLYEIEYKVTKTQNQCIYKATYIKPVSALVERINYIVNIFNKMNQTDAFEKWFRERYKLSVVR